MYEENVYIYFQYHKTLNIDRFERVGTMYNIILLFNFYILVERIYLQRVRICFSSCFGI